MPIHKVDSKPATSFQIQILNHTSDITHFSIPDVLDVQKLELSIASPFRNLVDDGHSQGIVKICNYAKRTHSFNQTSWRTEVRKF